MHTSFVLSGGGARGDFEVGAIKFLFESGIRPDFLIGTSVGALNSAKLAEGGPTALLELERIWRDITRSSYVYADSPAFAILKDKAPEAAKLLEQAVVGSIAGARLEAAGIVPFGTVLGGVVGIINFATTEVQKFLQEGSMYVLDPIRQNVVNSRLNLQKMRNSGIRVRLVAVSLETGDQVYTSESGEMTGKGWRIGSDGVVKEVERPPQQVDFVEAMMASASIPIVFAPVEIAGEHFVDGGVRQVAPTRAVLDALADSEGNLPAGEIVYVIADSPKGLPPWRPGAIPNSPDWTDGVALIRVMIRTLETLVDEIYVRDLNVLESAGRKNGAKIVSIHPLRDVHDALLFNPTLIAVNMSYGYNRAADTVLAASQGLQDATGSLLQADLDLSHKAEEVLGPQIRDVNWLISEAYEYNRDPNSWARRRHRPPGDPVPPGTEADMQWTIAKLNDVAALVHARKAQGFATHSLGWEIARTFDWELGRASNLEVRVNGRIASAIDFGALHAGETKTAVVSVVNDGPVIATLDIALSGQFNATNTFVDPAGGQQVGPSTFALFSIRYVQNAPSGFAGGVLTLTTNSPAQPSIILGLAALNPAPRAEVNPQVLDFGGVVQGAALVVRKAMLTNFGVETLTAALSFTGVSSDRYRMGAGAPVNFVLAHNKSSDIEIILLTDTTGEQLATLDIATNDPSQPVIHIPLQGRVDPSGFPRLRLIPASLDFGQVRLSGMGTLELQAENHGSQELLITLMGVSGPLAMVFLISPQPMPVRIAPAQTAPLATVGFRPFAAGPVSTELQLRSNDPTALAVNVPLSGTGV